jgi:hypothetical protein
MLQIVRTGASGLRKMRRTFDQREISVGGTSMPGRARVYAELPNDITDDAARRFLEVLLELRRQARAGKPPGLRKAKETAVSASMFVRSVIAWTENPLGLRVPSETFVMLKTQHIDS